MNLKNINMKKNLLMLTLVFVSLMLISCKDNTRVESITLNHNSYEITEGESFELSATYSPDVNDPVVIKWTVSNSEVVQIKNTQHNRCEIYGLSAGKATVNASITTSEYSITAKCDVIVAPKEEDNKNEENNDDNKDEEKDKITSITLDKTSCDLAICGTSEIIATFTPTVDYPLTVQWISSDASIVEVRNATENSCEICALKEGKATITCKETSFGNEVSATCEVVVYIPEMVISPSCVKLHYEDMQNLSVTGNISTINWSTENNFVASINEGVITAEHVGSTNVVAETEYQKAVCKVIVEPEYFTYMEPLIDWNLTKEQILEQKGTPDATQPTSVAYIQNADKGIIEMYIFDENDKLIQTGVMLKICAENSDVSSFLLERYELAVKSGSTYGFINAMSVDEADLLIGFTVSDYILVYYTPYNNASQMPKRSAELNISNSYYETSRLLYKQLQK